MKEEERKKASYLDSFHLQISAERGMIRPNRANRTSVSTTSCGIINGTW